MECQSAQYWLLQAESLRYKSWPKEVGQHVDTCAICAKFARDLRELEDEWREQPLPAGTKAKAAFLKMIQPPPARPPSLPIAYKAKYFIRRPVSWAAAAVVLIGIGGTWGLLSINNKSHASDVVDRLIDWNLELTAARPEDRKRLLEEHEPVLRQRFQEAKAKLTPEERELGERLLADGTWMATNDDPIEESHRITKLADTLSGMKAANDGKKEREHDELRFMRVMHFGVNPCVDRVEKLKPPDPKMPFTKGFGPPMTPQQFMEKQNEIRRQFEMLNKKGFGFRPPPFGKKK